jgi:hypothetical protein
MCARGLGGRRARRIFPPGRLLAEIRGGPRRIAPKDGRTASRQADRRIGPLLVLRHSPRHTAVFSIIRPDWGDYQDFECFVRAGGASVVCRRDAGAGHRHRRAVSAFSSHGLPPGVARSAACGCAYSSRSISTIALAALTRAWLFSRKKSPGGRRGAPVERAQQPRAYATTTAMTQVSRHAVAMRPIEHRCCEASQSP